MMAQLTQVQKKQNDKKSKIWVDTGPWNGPTYRFENGKIVMLMAN